jgi:hypothetical protein
MRLPKIALLGMGRAGKDEAGKWFGKYTPLKYVGSTSMVICPMIAAERGMDVKECWKNRHQERMLWYSWANHFRRDNPAKLAQTCLEVGDLVIGMRDKLELQACKDIDLFDLIVWINRDVPDDPTVTFRREDCDIIIDNNESLDVFFTKLKRLAQFAGVPVSDTPDPNFVDPADLMQ